MRTSAGRSAVGADPAQPIAIDEQRAVVDLAPAAPRRPSWPGAHGATGSARSSLVRRRAAGTRSSTPSASSGNAAMRQRCCAASGLQISAGPATAAPMSPSTAQVQRMRGEQRAPCDRRRPVVPGVRTRHRAAAGVAAHHQVEVAGGAVEQPAHRRQRAVEAQRRTAAAQLPAIAAELQRHAGAMQHGEPAVDAGEVGERTVALDLGDADAQVPLSAGRPGQQLARGAAAVPPRRGRDRVERTVCRSLMRASSALRATPRRGDEPIGRPAGSWRELPFELVARARMHQPRQRDRHVAADGAAHDDQAGVVAARSPAAAPPARSGARPRSSTAPRHSGATSSR